MMDKNVLLVGGVGRSGTSILSKLLATTEKSEFFYEPPVFMHLLESFSSWKENDGLKELLESIIYKDLLKGALSGRALNLNRNDISSVYNYKSEEEIKGRFVSSYRQEQLEAEISASNAVIKVLDNICNFSNLTDILPIFKAVVIIRNPTDTAKSLKVKGWFSDNQLSVNAPEPLRQMKVKNGRRYHLFLDDKDYEMWDNMTELDRIGFYYKTHFEKFSKSSNNSDLVFVTYNALTEKPAETFEWLCDTLKLKGGPKTSEILNSIGVNRPLTKDFEKVFRSSKYAESCFDLFESLSTKTEVE